MGSECSVEFSQGEELRLDSGVGEENVGIYESNTSMGSEGAFIAFSGLVMTTMGLFTMEV